MNNILTHKGNYRAANLPLTTGKRIIAEASETCNGFQMLPIFTGRRYLRYPEKIY
jgi:hypothetical protein